MIGDAAFRLTQPEACPRPSMFYAKTYITTPTGPKPVFPLQTLGRKLEIANTALIAEKIFNKLPIPERGHIIGFSVLKMCEAHDPVLLERGGNFAFWKAGSEKYDVTSLHDVTDDGICSASVFGGTGRVPNCVDFPHVDAEKGLMGVQVVEAAVSTPMQRASIIVRPNVQLITAADLQ